MPFRKRIIKRRPRRVNRKYGRTRKVPNNRVARPLRPRTYNFTRSFAETIELNNTTPPLGWTSVDNGLVRSQPFKLADLPNYLEFVNLFSQYRLLAVKQEMYFSNTNSVNNVIGTQSDLGNKQIIMYCNPNMVGYDNTSLLTEQFFLESQSSKKKLCLNAIGRPVKIYSKVKQLVKVFSDELDNTDYSKAYPKFVSTGDINTEHYGLDMRLARIDGNIFSTGGNNYPSVKIITKVYLQCRQVS